MNASEWINIDNDFDLKSVRSKVPMPNWSASISSGSLSLKSHQGDFCFIAWDGRGS